ncbi:hypothetical protein WOLCODRAFT_113675 [Wolfiporia cocos MD-104 SS10]|uniref:Cohesin loading factor n=1 Tax=Wolfiporia cocos (strain MD-104) TaxID=742152 RepID=A0A2H3IWL4_WOLCO|nr:hypothetical protein WOLCODRAFT_113675 [Wolfiporia cocos MD-104 SS10]
MRVISGGLSAQHDEHPWAKGIEAEVEKAMSKGSIIAQKHPSLRAYKHHLALLQAQLSHWQHKPKFARNQLRNLLSSFLPTDPPHTVYAAHLAYISLLTTPTASSSHTTPPNVSPTPCSQDVHAALGAVDVLAALSQEKRHRQVALLVRVLRLRVLVAAGMWDQVHKALMDTECAFGLSYEPCITPRPRKAPQGGSSQEGSQEKEKEKEPDAFIAFEDTLEAALVMHVLMMAVIFFTHVGDAPEASPRLSHLHALLDSGVLERFPDGMLEIAFPNDPPLIVQVTHPRILLMLAFLVSATAKRDAVGRKPKRKVFASTGLSVWDTEISREISFALWAGLADVEEVEQRLARIKADLLCEIIAVSIMRSEFDTAEEDLNTLIAHTRTHSLFPLFVARIALHHAYLAHALGQTARALQCYRVAAHRAERGSFVEVAARAGEVALRIGVQQHANGMSAEDEGVVQEYEEELQVAKACQGQGGALEAVGHVVEACVTPEILKAKQHLKNALNFATRAQDNHLRALILTLISSHYFHTAAEHALGMLKTAEQLAAGLGAPPAKPSSGTSDPKPINSSESHQKNSVGNAPLGLWVGERSLELFKRAGKDARAQKQMAINARLARAVEELAKRGDSTTALSAV